ncbi:hypothetical protein [Aquimonas voraii]|uniref:Putative transposase n=1 Tax=Aquimonas voraii TaxID=265719 RepID=A0A1G6UZU9_9GAMM|nr:hypothetical protein [Aquimonas voraii]SDD46197.1 putative transposase [Aquimonas voraii]
MNLTPFLGYRYIELNPVRAGRVPGAREYPWSSHARNAYGSHDPGVTPHVAYLRLGSTDDERPRAYRQLIAEALDPQDTADLRAHTQQQRVWGSDRLRAQIEALTQRATTVRPRGRPRSPENDPGPIDPVAWGREHVAKQDPPRGSCWVLKRKLHPRSR